MISLINCCVNGISLSENLSNRNAARGRKHTGQQMSTRDSLQVCVFNILIQFEEMCEISIVIDGLYQIAWIFDKSAILKENFL